ncbi:MAG: translation initiation factor IF-2 [Paenibacillaceae bacterium]
MTNQENEKTRVYEYAKSLNMSSKEIITILKRLDIPVNNHMSVMENDTVQAVEKFFRDIKANAAAKRAAAEAVSIQAAKQQSSGGQQALKPSRPVGSQPMSTPTASANPTKFTTAPTTSTSSSSTGVSSPSASTSASQNARVYPPSSNPQQSRTQGQSTGSSQSSRPSGSYQGSQRPGQGQQLGRGPASSSPRPGGSSTGQQSSRPPYQSRPAVPPKPAVSTVGEKEKRTTTFTDNKRPAKPFVGRVGDTEDKSKIPSKKTAPIDKRFEDSRSNSRPGNYRNKGKNNRRNNGPIKEKIDNTPKKIIVRGPMTVGDFAKILHKDASEVIKKLLFLGVMSNINQELDLDTIQLIATDYKIEVEVKIAVDEDNFELVEETDIEDDLIERPPVVTIMGHVDHGKTTLLDAIRHTNVTLGEAGGITQHIGAYQVEVNQKKITFLDTPGHEAFTLMRARGAQVTDITILVVAADDGVMPQTIEAINHAKAANVPIIVAVNKIDKPGADPDRVKQELNQHGLIPEEWGGETIFVNVSAKNRTGLEDLLEMILLVAEVREFKANVNKRARGTVLEAELDKGKGPVARVLIQNGTIRVGDAFVAGVHFGRVRTMINDKGRRVKEAPPSTPVEITGLTEVPLAGDPFIVFEDERKARAIAERRSDTARQSSMSANTRVSLEDMYQHIKDGELKDLTVIIKGDVQGSVEALRGSLEKIDVEGARVKIIHIAVGSINESDVNLAYASNAIIIGFNVRPEAAAKSMADEQKVDVRLYTVIYNAIEEIEAAMKGLLDPIFKETILGHAEVRNVFKVTKVGVIAGCMVQDGKMVRNAQIRLLRAGVLVYEGKLDSLKRFKDDAKEVAQGYECGISLEKFNDIKDGDIIEAFMMETVER